ncbi:hypothetical protein clem_01805 [Legionella clemsonensis]|uniref:Uncharacterized protein n=1 Tax=Legionella clemsonensis TaxID=1867846 RepID=A0A222NZA2_9GAMM|nr:hypothetical protein clem_01805 [Legionella clemsonensis]
MRIVQFVISLGISTIVKVSFNAVEDSILVE